METITNESQVEKLENNKIIGSFKLTNSRISFNGQNNILVCDNDINFTNAVLTFNGDNSLIYIRSNIVDGFRSIIYNNSTLYIGKNVFFGSSVNISVYESQNIIIGDDCILNAEAKMFSADFSSIYDCQTKKRKNFSRSVYIGDHVWLGRYSYISRGVHIGSGAIIGDGTFVMPNEEIPSNTLSYGNPSQIVDTDVFYTRDFAGGFKRDETLNSEYYKSDVFIFKFVDKETFNIDSIDQILFDLDVASRVEFIQKLLIRNKRMNRFYID